MKTFLAPLAASWLIWGAMLPILAGLLLAPALGLEQWVGCVLGGAVAVPLSLLGLRLADRAASAEPTVRVAEGHVASPPAASWEPEFVGKVLLCLTAVALGLAGLIAGRTVVVVPSGQAQPGQGLAWAVTGPLAWVVAVGLLGIGLGGLVKLRSVGRRVAASWAIGVGVLLVLGGSLIHGLATLVAGWVAR